ncbi:MAG: M28 family peptidase [Thermodesulfobacteriota bacterium]
MDSFLEKLPSMVDAVRAIKEIIIANIVLIGQVPSPTFKEEKRTQVFMERLAEAQIDECTTDAYGNPIGIIHGSNDANAPIFVVAHLDTHFGEDVDHNFTVKKRTIAGPGILDNSLGVGVMASLPEILRGLGLRFKSDIVLVGDIQSIGKGNLRGIRNLLKTWPTPIRGAVCIEGGELGRLNYFSDGMRRCEITCSIPSTSRWSRKFRPNAILILHEVIDRILKLRFPQKPRARVIIGKIAGGVEHGEIAQDAVLGFEIQSDSDKMVKAIYRDIRDIKNGISHEHEVELQLRTISSLNAARIGFNHPLVKNAAEVLKKLELKPVSVSSETELSIFLYHKIPAVTIGITRGENYHLEDAFIKIEPMYKGIAQLISILKAIDSGVCDEQ